jgi:hypothetical protein
MTLRHNGKYNSIDEIPNYDSYPIAHNNDPYDRGRSTLPLTSVDENLLVLLENLKRDITFMELGCEACCRLYHVLI